MIFFFISVLRTSILCRKVILKSLSGASAILHFSEPTFLGLLGYTGDILS